MSAICRIYERRGHGVHFIAEVRGGRVTGIKAAEIRKLLKQYGFPHAPLEAVVDQLLLANKKLGVAFVAGKEDQ